MPDEDNDLRSEVALFRFRLIGALLHLPPGSDELAAGLRKLAASEHEIPGRRRRRVARSTLCAWLRQYRQGGFAALHPKRLFTQLWSFFGRCSCRSLISLSRISAKRICGHYTL